GCSLDPIDYKGKGCPCLADLTCQIVPRQCIVAPGAPQPSLGCVIYTDGMLYCGNASGSQMRSAPRASAPVVDTLRTSYSWFICWGPASSTPAATRPGTTRRAMTPAGGAGSPPSTSTRP